METRRGVMTHGRAARGDCVTLPWRPGRQRGGMAEKAKPRAAGAKSRRDKSRTPVRAQPRQPKKSSSKSPGRTSAHLTASPGDDGGRSPPEPLDAGPILDDLLDRVMTECALAAAARQRVPFAVSRARDAILFVAEWRFLVRDDGEPDPEGDADPERDGVWSEDEEPQSCTWDSWTPGVVTVVDASLPGEQVSVTAEAGGPPECPSEVPDAVPVEAGVPPECPSEVPDAVPVEAGGPPERPGEVPDAVPDLAARPLSPGQVDDAEPPCPEPSAAAEAPPAQVPDAVPVLAEPRVPSPEPPIAPRPPGRGSRLTWPPGRGSRLTRPPRPRPAPPRPPRPPAPVPAEPPEPPAQEPQESREATAEDSGQVSPPPPSSRSSLAPIQAFRPARGTGMSRLSVRRLATRWVLPEVRVVDLTSDADRARAGASRTRLPPSGSRHVLPGPGRPPRAEPQLCDPWLASARLAPGVTVRWGGSERRGPAPVGHTGQGDREQQEDEAVRRAEPELKPILPYPECRISE